MLLEREPSDLASRLLRRRVDNLDDLVGHSESFVTRHANMHFCARAVRREVNKVPAQLGDRFVKIRANFPRSINHSLRLPTRPLGFENFTAVKSRQEQSAEQPVHKCRCGNAILTKLNGDAFISRSDTSAQLKCARPVRLRVAGIGTPFSFGSAAA